MTIVGISGPSGTGKTTAAIALRRLGYSVVIEPRPLGLRQVGFGTPGAGYKAQRSLTKARFDAASTRRSSLLFMDRTLEEDSFVFFEIYRSLGELSDVEIACLREQPWMRSAQTRPSHLCVLTISYELARSRLLARPSVPEWLISTLRLQLELYDRWIDTTSIPYSLVEVSDGSQRALLDRILAIAKSVG